MTTWQDYLEEHTERYTSELLEFLRIPSISSLSEHAPDVERAADWVANRMRAAGIDNVQIMPTGGHPVVYGDWLHAPEGPTILIYGHFDTQPVDPVDLWTRPPFEPVIIDDRVYARGASDDKGNMLVPILALEALLQSEGKLPVNVKCFFEGQEEIGSPQLPAFVEAHRDLLACDLVLSADGAQWGVDQPHLCIGLKGLAGVQIDVIGARTDLHSGLYGGSVQNATHALVQILASMRDADGSIQVDGFYDEVSPLSEQDRAFIGAVPFDDEALMRDLGVDALFGEPGYSTLERQWARPTLEINGLWGGFQGEGVKTVIPNEAHAKITCRLVANQDPQRVIEALTRHVARHAPPGVRATVQPFEATAAPYLMPADHWGNRAAHAVLKELYGKEPFYTRTGGSIPVTTLFHRHLGAYSVIYAFALDDEQFHAPDEFFRLENFRRGQAAYCMLLHRLGHDRLDQS
jgi:acetylornithine deacetylase/succinyl-diaminopimelate desuccinylase-like protein